MADAHRTLDDIIDASYTTMWGHPDHGTGPQFGGPYHRQVCVPFAMIPTAADTVELSLNEAMDPPKVAGHG